MRTVAEKCDSGADLQKVVMPPRVCILRSTRAIYTNHYKGALEVTRL